MQEYEPSGGIDDRQAHLAAAAEALVAWVHERRATWAGQPDVVVPKRAARVARPPARVAAVEDAVSPAPITFDQLVPIPEPPSIASSTAPIAPRVVTAPAPPANVVPIAPPVVAEPNVAPIAESIAAPASIAPIAPPVATPPAPPLPASVAPMAPPLVMPLEPPLPAAVGPIAASVSAPAAPTWHPLEPVADSPDFSPHIESPDLRPTTAARARARIGSGAMQLGAPVLRWSLRIGASAVVLIVGISIGWRARPYFSKLSTNFQKLTTTETTGTAVVESVPPGAEVFVDGVAAGTAPLTTELKAGHHTIEFRRRKDTRTLEIDVKAGEATPARLDWNAARTGRLVVNSDPAGSHVLVDGHDRGVTPLTLDVAVGSHAVVIENGQGSVRRTVAITTDRPVQLSESIYAGLLKVFAPFDLQITENGKALRLDDQNQVMLPSGPHELQIENRAFGYRQVSRVDVEPGVTTSLSIVPSPSMLSVTSTLPATVAIDGEAAGETPLTDAPIKLGTHEIVVKSASGDRRFTRTVTVAPVHIDVDFSQP